jgi:hypothetical protein
MKSSLALLSLLFAVLLVQGYARMERVSASVHVGKVEALYEEAHPGVFVPRRAADRGAAPLWVHVRFDRPLDDGRDFAVAALPRGMSAGIDDTVEMQFGDANQFDESGPERNVVTAVIGPAAKRSPDLRAAAGAGAH